MKQGKRDINRKLKILRHGADTGNIAKTCRYFGISREIFYQWRRTYAEKGESGLINSKPCPENPKLRVPAPIAEKILYLRQTYHLGAMRISWFLERYHGIKVSSGGVYGVLKRNGLNRLPQSARKRTITTHRYEKQVPGHHIQVDVKFLKFENNQGHNIRRFQYTAIDLFHIEFFFEHFNKGAILAPDTACINKKFKNHFCTIRIKNDLFP